MAIRTLRPDDETFLCNFDVFKWLYLSQISPIKAKLGDFLNLDMLFLTMWINGC